MDEDQLSTQAVPGEPSRKLFAAPVLGLVPGGGAVLVASFLFESPSLVLGATVKGLGFAVPYLLVLLLLEWRDHSAGLQAMHRLLRFSRALHRSKG